MTGTYRSFGQWELKKCLGKGGFGEVIHWMNVHSNQEIAVKTLRETGSLSADIQHRVKERWMKEYQWMQNLKTSFIVGSTEVQDLNFVDYLNREHAWSPLPVIIMEYCNGGDLRSQLRQVENFNGLPEFEVRQVLYALRHAIDYLHNVCRIEHRDLKPENIVMHQIGNKRLYKLADFGLARAITDNTNLKTCVFTEHYFAPEIITTSKYKENVDYWSLGVIAFELICGLLPFIPHQGMLRIIENLAKKPASCIAITEKCQPGVKKTPSDDKPTFEFEQHLFAENCVSSVFQRRMEDCLRLTFDTNYATRGTRPMSEQNPQRVLAFYSELDAILDSKILSVFHLNTCRFYYFDAQQDLAAFVAQLEAQTKMPKVHSYLVFPTGHKPGKLDRSTTPLQLFMAEWQDTSNELTPPAMLYMVSLQCDFLEPLPHISDVIKKCMSLDANDYLPEWYLDRFERHAHYLLATEDKRLRAFLNGLKEYAVIVEHEALEFKPHMAEMSECVVFMLGCIKQFTLTIESAKEAYGLQNESYGRIFAQFDGKCEELNRKMRQVHKDVAQATDKRYNSVLRRIKQQATNSLFDDLAKDDPYHLDQFRKNLQQARRLDSHKIRLDFAQKSVRDCLGTMQKTLTNKRLEAARMDIAEIHQEYIKIKAIVRGLQVNYLTAIDQQLKEATLAFHTAMRDSHGGPVNQQMSQMCLDPSMQQTLESLHDIYNMPTRSLIDDVLESVQQMELDLDGDIPATIPNPRTTLGGRFAS